MLLGKLLEPDELRHLNAVADWLGRCRRGYVVDELRNRYGDMRSKRRRARHVVSIDEVPPPVDQAEPVLDQMIRAERIATVRDMVQRLPERQRETMELRLQGHSVIEAAKAMGCTVHGVDMHIRRAKATLRHYLEGV